MSASDTADPRRERIGFGPLIVGCGLFMQGLDGSAIATALPAMAQSLGQDPVRLNLAISSYLLAAAVCIPASGWAADRYGARRVFCAAIVLFAVSSVLCGLSQSLGQLVAARVLQGVAAALMIPVGRLIVLRNSPRSQLVRAMSYLTIPAVMGPVLGPPIGGLIAVSASWRWIFFINLPISVLGLWAALRFIPAMQGARTNRFDLSGFVVLGAGIASLVFALHEIVADSHASAPSLALLVVGALSLALYPALARRKAAPVLDLGLLSIPTFRVAVLAGGAWRIAMGATPILLPLLLQLGFGLNALSSGLISFSVALGALCMKGVTTPILRRFGFRNVLTFNAVLTGSLLAAQALFQPSTPYPLIIMVLFAAGFTRSLQFTALGVLSYSDIPPAGMSRASAFGSMAQELCQAIGATLATVLLQSSVALLGRDGLDRSAISLSIAAAGLIAILTAPLLARLGPQDGGQLFRA